jgi:CRP-like cAMP-binding protein/Fe-S-cluster-containing hydrogenase component 2
MAKDVIQAADLGGTPISAEELAKIPDFAGIRPNIWEKFPGAISKQTYKPGEFLMREGESGNTAFYLLSGAVDVYIANPIGGATTSKGAARKSFFRGFTKLTDFVKGVPPSRSDKTRAARTHIPIDAAVDLPISNPIAELKAGDLIGELAALAALKQDRLKRPKFYPRSATVRAKTDVVALEMLPNILNNVLYNAPAFKNRLNDSYRERALASHLLSVPMFAGLSAEFLESLKKSVELIDVPPGEVIVRQGDVADAFYLIRLGFVKVSQEFPGGELVLNYLSRGNFFGEMGLLPPAFRVRARGPQPGQIAEGAVAAQPVRGGRAPESEPALLVPWDEFISRDHFQMCVEGNKVRVTRLASGRNPITFQMRPSDSFLISPGESFVVGNTTFEILEDPLQAGRRTATCTAVDYVQLVKMKAGDFAAMLEQHPSVKSSIIEMARSRRQMDAQILNRVQTLPLNSFLEQELMQGQNLLLIDLERCTRCDDCVKACQATHDDGVTRLIRDGLRFDKYLVPTSCRACMDPLCMTRCPVGAIRRKETLDIVIEPWCIGCSNCATDCPYGNINVTLIPDRAGGSAKKAEYNPKAVVCDLCVEYPEPNCVRACPHDAALRVEPKEFFARDLAGSQLAVAVEQPGQAAASGPAPPHAHVETQVLSNLSDMLGLMPRLNCLAGDRAGQTLQLRFPETSFGRSPEADYRFADDDQVSRLHCKIVSEAGNLILRDLQSTNGTRLNGNPVTAGVQLKNGDIIELGAQKFEFLEGQPS